MKNNIFLGIYIILLAFIVVGCEAQQMPNIPSDNGMDDTNDEQQIDDEDLPPTPSVPTVPSQPAEDTSVKLPDISLSNFEMYDGNTKEKLSGPIIASVPVEMRITLTNDGNAPYVGPKGNAPIIISMITQAYGSNVYFYPLNSNYSVLNPGESRVFKTNVLKYRSVGTFNADITYSIQYTTQQPEESDNTNNKLTTELIVQAK